MNKTQTPQRTGFARLWVAGLFSETAEWMLQVALPVFVYQLTGSAASTAVGMLAAGALVGRVGLAGMLNTHAALCVAAGMVALISLTRRAATVEECQVSSPPVTSM